MTVAPSIVMIGGPNGAGKTTISRAVIADTLGVAEFVNADVIAQGLSGFDPERAALRAGRVMIERLRELAEKRADFAFETTMASRTFAPWLNALVASGYRLHVVFVWLRSDELAISRVAARVRKGGHFVPDETVRQRYRRGITNFVRLYRPIAHAWRVYDNSGDSAPRLIASEVVGGPIRVLHRSTLNSIEEIAHDQAPGGQVGD